MWFESGLPTSGYASFLGFALDWLSWGNIWFDWAPTFASGWVVWFCSWSIHGWLQLSWYLVLVRGQEQKDGGGVRGQLGRSFQPISFSVKQTNECLPHLSLEERASAGTPMKCRANGILLECPEIWHTCHPPIPTSQHRSSHAFPQLLRSNAAAPTYFNAV